MTARPSLSFSLLLAIPLVGAACGSGGNSASPDSGASTDDASTPGAPDASTDGAPVACGALGATCSTAAGCCSAYCKTGVCTCNSDGYACTTNADCCASDCNEGKCGAAQDGAPSSTPSGVLETGFGTHGCTTLAYAGNVKNNSRPFSAALDASGNFFVVGGTETDGIGDTSASMSGWFTMLSPTGAAATNLALSPSFGTIYDLALSPAGAPTLFGDGSVMRTSAAGAADPTFGFDDGDAGVASGIESAFYQSTGALVLRGGPGILRVTSSGALDTGFGDGGSIAFATAALPLSADTLAIDATDRLYVAGVASVGGTDHWMLARFSPSGALDTTFGVQGIADAGPAPYFSGYLSHFLLRGSHTGSDFYIVATYEDPNLNYTPLWIVHAGPSGVDAAYGGGGHAVVQGPAMAGPYPDAYPSVIVVDAAVQDDGKLVLVGTDSMGEYWYLTRITTTGIVDAAYGTSGWVDTSANSPQAGTGTTVYAPVSITLASDGGAIVVEARGYDLNLYSEESAIVCKYTP